ncbi:hypothetical protein LEMLEM_LOCUS9035 [Lemmus lemmus]
MEQKECKSQRRERYAEQEVSCKRQDMPFTWVNSLWLWLPLQDLTKNRSVNISSWVGNAYVRSHTS